MPSTALAWVVLVHMVGVPRPHTVGTNARIAGRNGKATLLRFVSPSASCHEQHSSRCLYISVALSGLKRSPAVTGYLIHRPLLLVRSQPSPKPNFTRMEPPGAGFVPADEPHDFY